MNNQTTNKQKTREVYNLATDESYTFFAQVPADYMVCWAYADSQKSKAERRALLEKLIYAKCNGVDLANVFPLVRGLRTVACGDWAAQI